MELEIIAKTILMACCLGLLFVGTALAITKEKRMEDTQRDNQEINIPGGVEDE